MLGKGIPSLKDLNNRTVVQECAQSALFEVVHLAGKSEPIIGHSIEKSIRDILREVVFFIRSVASSSQAPAINERPVNITAHDTLAREIENVLKSREFNYQSKHKINHHTARIRKIVSRHVEKNEAIPLYLDLGGGYHASTDIHSDNSLSFNAGIGEVLVIFQIAKLQYLIRALYGPGIRFGIVIDNRVAHYVNDIPLKKTSEYCMELRGLIDLLGMNRFISVVVESELGEWSADDTLSHRVDEPKSVMTNDMLDAKAYSNVMRFLGRECSTQEAIERLGKYEVGIQFSDRFLNRFIGDEIRFVQQSSSGQLTFRPFPGGASRIQCGLVGFELMPEKYLRPVLITSELKKKRASSRIGIDIQPAIREILSDAKFAENTPF